MNLTKSEMEMLRYLARGLVVKEIASVLNISPKTVEAHRYNLYKKFNVHSVVTAVIRGMELGLLPLPVVRRDGMYDVGSQGAD